jgi:DNA primase
MMDQVFYEKLTNVCHDLLGQNKQLRTYLNNRGITKQTIDDYKLGAFPSDLRYLYTKLSAQELLSRGIVYRADKSPFSQYPLVIPIRDASGSPVAIGCRTLLSEEDRKKLGLPKYRNSVYSKSSYLFGLDKAIPAIRKKNRVYVVEGYFDAISAHQAGMGNVVATCGTLFSSRQLTILSRYTDKVCILFDNDEAGKCNAKIVKDKFANNGFVSISCAITPNKYKDLDEYLTQGGSLDYFDLEF